MIIPNHAVLPLLMAAAAAVVRGDNAASKTIAASEVIPASEAIAILEVASVKPECGDVLTFYHFNDVHNSLNREHVGRFATLLRQAREGLDPLKLESPKPKGSAPPMVVLSSKIFAPRQNTSAGDVTAVLQRFPIDVVCCVSDSAPGSNAASYSPYSQPLSSPHINLAEADIPSDGHLPPEIERVFEIKEHGPYRIGFFGMVGIDWDAANPPSEKMPRWYVQQLVNEAQTNTRILRKEHGCDFVIAVTNMRLIEDLLVSNATTEGDNRIDLIFGGYDGEVLQRRVGEGNANPAVGDQGQKHHGRMSGGWRESYDPSIRLIKSGTEWEGLSVVEVCIDGKESSGMKRPQMSTIKVTQIPRVQRHPLFSQLEPSQDILEIVDTVNGPALQNLTQRPLFISRAKLNGHEHTVRHAESNLGNFIADSMLAYHDADVALLPSRSIRCDRLLGGPEANSSAPIALTGYDVIDCLPFQNNLVVKLVSGKELLAALENSLSDRHADGRFLQLAGLRVQASWQRPQGQRVISANWTLDLLDGTEIREPVYPEQEYMVAMTEWLADGWGGYDMLRGSPVVRGGPEVGITDTDLLLSTFAEWDEADERWLRSDKGESAVGEYLYDDEQLSPRLYNLRNVRTRIVYDQPEGSRLPGVWPRVDGRIKFVKEHRVLNDTQYKALEGGVETPAMVAMKTPVEGQPVFAK